MNKNLTVSKSIEIQSTAQSIWEVLTNPEKIKIYLYGTNTTTDWEAGSPILFQGEFQGHQYQDKGTVLENSTNEVLRYSYWSGFSGLPDLPENYSEVCYRIQRSSETRSIFSWTQTGFASEQGQQHLESGLPAILEQIKNLAENV